MNGNENIMTPVIKFSHLYTKFPLNPSPSTILEVFVVGDDLSDGFINYDTQILDGGNYPIVHGKKLVLLLQNIDGILWTTIRRHTPCKERYYRETRGSVVNIVRSLNDYL